MDVLDLTQKLCAFNSTSGQEQECMNYLADILEQQGYQVHRQKVSKNRDNIYAFRDTPKVLLTTHIDTVPPYFEAYIEEEMLYGRGVSDAKGIAAAMICAAESLHQQNIDQVALLFVVGEETKSDGAKHAAKDTFMHDFDYFIDGEPTEMKLCVGMKGTLMMNCVVHGKACHSAYPEQGINANHILLKNLHKILEEKWPNDVYFGQTTVNIGQINAGVAANVISSKAEAKVFFRTTIETAQITKRLKELLDTTVEIEIYSESNPQKLFDPGDDFMPPKEKCVVAFGSDVPHLAAKGKALLIGPGSILDAHTAHEKVKIKDLYRAQELYIDLTKHLLKQKY